MKIALLRNDKSFLSFDLKDLLWLILVVGVWATLDYRIKYTNNVLRWNEDLQKQITRQRDRNVQLTNQLGRDLPTVISISEIQEQAIRDTKELLREDVSSGGSDQVSWKVRLQVYLNKLDEYSQILHSHIALWKQQMITNQE
jgi:hypothetical protein